MSGNAGNRKAPLIEIAKAVGPILGVPLALFAIVSTVVEQPIIALVVALIMAVLASVWVVRSGWTGITEMIVAWLVLIVVILAGFVIWPRTMTVEGIIRDTTGNPVRNEVVVLFDRNNKKYETKTNTEGHYQFTEVSTGKYMVRVRESEVEGETKGILVRVVQQNLTVPETLAAAFPTPTPTETPSSTPRPIETPSPTPTPTNTSTLTPSATNTPTPTPTSSATPTPSGILIDDFEDGIDGWYAAHAGTNSWGPNEVALNVFPSRDATVGNGALQCDFDFNLTDKFDPRATCFLVELPAQDWTKYNALQFKAKSLVDASYNIRVFIALATGENSCWNELGDFKMLESEYQTFTFNLDLALYRTCQSYEDYNQVLIGKDHVVRLHLIFTADHKPSGAVLVDEIWLIKP
jgi:hypothetical protein